FLHGVDVVQRVNIAVGGGIHSQHSVPPAAIGLVAAADGPGDLIAGLAGQLVVKGDLGQAAGGLGGSLLKGLARLHAGRLDQRAEGVGLVRHRLLQIVAELVVVQDVLHGVGAAGDQQDADNAGGQHQQYDAQRQHADLTAQ